MRDECVGNLWCPWLLCRLPHTTSCIYSLSPIINPAKQKPGGYGGATTSQGTPKAVPQLSPT